MQSYQISSNSTTEPQVYSFHIMGFWHHVKMNGNIGVDQRGDRWILRSGKLYSEFNYYIIDIKNCFTPKKDAA